MFIEDYSIWVCRYLVQGVDLWLNTPRRLNEASGTSGMKAAANGAINMSILDGWWEEAYQTDIGWAIGQREVYADLGYQDMVESNAIYKMLEKEIVPMFYDRGVDKLPRRWIARMKASMRAICPVFNTNRMVYEYYEKLYRSSHHRSKRLSVDDFDRAKALAAWKSRVRAHWQPIKISNVASDADKADTHHPLEVGSEVAVQADVYLGELEPNEVSVQIYHGGVDPKDEIVAGQSIEMEVVQSKGDGVYLFKGAIPCTGSGLHGYSVRALPKHEHVDHPSVMNLITWAG